MEFKQKCIDLRLQNYTLGEMVKILNRPKTTIFFHIQNIPKGKLLSEKLSKISRQKISKARENGLTTKKGVSWKGRHCKEFKEWTPELVNLVAHVIFDGEIRNCGTMYHNRSVALIDNFKKKVELIYDYEPIMIKNKDGVFRLSYHSVELTNFLRIKKQELTENILKFSSSFQKEFLIAFFDDEGNITFNGKKRIVRGYQHNLKILEIVKKLLLKFGINSHIDKRYFEIIIGRRENILKFSEEINFSKGLRVNGKRSNSIWKKSLEKRKILQMALASYQTN